MTELQIAWFCLVGVLLAGYAILDGFDLGVGSLHLFAKGDRERRVMLNSIGPVWDGNEVWLVTGGGALFAAFPEVYATVFSGFYTGFMLFLTCLILRVSSIEFRSKMPMAWWQSLWDGLFFLSSSVAAVLLGVVAGNLLRGIPLDANHEFTGGFTTLLNPFGLLMGATTLCLFHMHGALYSALKTEGELQDRARSWARRGAALYAICYVSTLAAIPFFAPHLTENYRSHPVLLLLPLVNVMATAAALRLAWGGARPMAFAASALSILTLAAVFAASMFPNLVYCPGAPENSLTIYNSSSSQKTLSIMLGVALVGMPLVIAYSSFVYWAFRGKVRLDAHSY